MIKLIEIGRVLAMPYKSFENITKIIHAMLPLITIMCEIIIPYAAVVVIQLCCTVVRTSALTAGHFAIGEIALKVTQGDRNWRYSIT